MGDRSRTRSRDDSVPENDQHHQTLISTGSAERDLILDEPNFHVVLIEPEIPQNTGSIGRLCLATGCTLHLVKPLGFSIDAQAVKRAGLDYWEQLDVRVHESSDDFFAALPEDAEIALIETRAGQTIYEFEFKKGGYLIFGKETTGLADWILNQYSFRLARIPMLHAGVRSLNLSNAVSISVYEALRQVQFSSTQPF